MKTEGKLIQSGLPCPNPDCGSSDAYAIYDSGERGITGYCFSCNTPQRGVDPEGIKDPPQSFKPIGGQMIDQIKAESTIIAIPNRGLTKEACEHFGVRCSVDESTGEIAEVHYPIYSEDGRLVGYKTRDADKKFRIQRTEQANTLFGQQTAPKGGKLLVITEGEFDAMSAWQMFQKRGKNYKVVSLPNGANTRAIRDNIEYLETFESIAIAFDQDEPGQKAAKEVSELLTPGKVKVMHFSEKDANDLLQANKGDEFFNSLWNASTTRPDGICSVEDIAEEAMKPVEWGLSFPWPTLTKATFGYRRGELYGIGAGSGAGKTEAFKEIINHVISVHNLPVGVLFLEEPAAKTLKVLAGKKFNKRFHIPGEDWTVDELQDGINSLKGKVYLYNHFGAKDWNHIRSKIKYMVTALGIKDIFLDHLTALVAQEDNEYKALNRIMEELASLTEELGCTIFYISHLRKPAGTPHEEGGRVTADQFKGSGSIVFWSHFLFGLERNSQAEDEDERNTTTFRVLKDRNTGLATGTTFKLKYHHDTGRWLEKRPEDMAEEL